VAEEFAQLVSGDIGRGDSGRGLRETSSERAARMSGLLAGSWLQLEGALADDSWRRAVGRSVDAGAAQPFRLDVLDSGEPGSADRFRLRVTGALDTGTQTLSGSNVQLHKAH
jgi:hypothetical protein